jgi:hypothetical protein
MCEVVCEGVQALLSPAMDPRTDRNGGEYGRGWERCGVVDQSTWVWGGLWVLEWVLRRE